MFNLITLVSLICIGSVAFSIHRDIISPPIILVFSWCLPFLWLIVAESFQAHGYDVGIWGLYFVIGVLCFIIGFYSVYNKIKITPIALNIIDRRRTTLYFKLFILFEIICLLYFVYDVVQFVNSHFQYNFWFTYKWNVSQGNYHDFFVIPYLRTASRVICCVMLVQYLTRGHDTRDTKWMVLQFVVTLVLNFLGQGRGGIFSFFIPLIITYLVIKRKSNRFIFRSLFIIFVLLLLIFAIYDSMKNPYANKQESFVQTFENYLCGGIVAFVNWAQLPHDYSFGIYTFRFLLAIMSALGFDVPVVNMAEDYVININGNVGNVYTFYKWYANDFGVGYALLCQIIIGAISGFLYKKLYSTNNEVILIIYAQTFYALFLQFFMDEYITMFSVWIQIIFWTYLFLKTDIFYSNANQGVINEKVN